MTYDARAKMFDRLCHVEPGSAVMKTDMTTRERMKTVQAALNRVRDTHVASAERAVLLREYSELVSTLGYKAEPSIARHVPSGKFVRIVMDVCCNVLLCVYISKR